MRSIATLWLVSIGLTVTVISVVAPPASLAQVQTGQSGEAAAILEEYRSVRPRDEDLALYRLDWAPTLREAKARAARERRPIFLIVVTNSYGNMYTGHC